MASPSPMVGLAPLSPRTPPRQLPAAAAATLAAQYYCPMHPEIEQDGAGTCPKCGMALESKNVAAPGDDDDPNFAT